MTATEKRPTQNTPTENRPTENRPTENRPTENTPSENGSRSSNPYIGPSSFRLGDELFGRDREREDLVDLLVAERIILLCSPSGAGKTSLIQAALIPALRKDGFEVLPVIRVTHAEGHRSDLPAPRNPYVMSVLLSLEEGVAPANQRPVAELATQTLPEYLDNHADRDGRPDNEVLIFDQFEEVLTADPTDEPAKHEFFKELGRVLRHRGRWAVFSMREDFLAALDPYLIHVPTRLRTTFRLDLLTVDQALEAIRRPAKHAKVDFTPEAAQQLVNDLRTVRVQRPGGVAEVPGSYVEPVQLQVACRLLWSRLPVDATEITPADVDALGRVDEALADYYAEVVQMAAKNTGVPERAIRDWFEDRLITPQGLRSQVLDGPKACGDAGHCLLLELLDAHLLRAETRRGAEWYELAHDRLIEPVRRDNAAWGTLHLSAFERAAALWDNEGRPDRLLLLGADLEVAEQDDAVQAGALTDRQRVFLEASRRAYGQVLRRSERRLQSVVAVVTVLMVAAYTLGLVAWVQARHASTSAQRATRASDLASARKLAAYAELVAGTRPDLAILLGLQSLSLARGQDESPPPGLVTGLAQLTHRTSKLIGPLGHALLDASFSPNGALLATAGADGTVRLWDTATGRPNGPFSAILTGHNRAVNAVAFSPDGRLLASAGDDATVRLWDTATGRPNGPFRAILTGRNGAVNAVAFSPDGRLLASAGDDATVRLWDTATGLPHQAPLAGSSGHAGSVNAVAFSPDGRLLASAGDDTSVRLWDTGTGKLHGKPLEGHVDRVNGLAFSPDGGLLASASADGTVRLWDVITGRAHGDRLTGHKGAVTAVAFSPDGTLLASAGADRAVRLWDSATGRSHGEPLVGHDGSVTAVAFNPDGRSMASASTDGTARLWEVADTYSVRRPLAVNPGVVIGAAFSPNGALLATANTKGAVRLWNPDTGQPRGLPLIGHDGPVYGVAFSPHGDLLASAGNDGTVRLWDPATGRPSGAPLTGHRGAVTAVAFSPDGALLATAGGDGTVRMWDTASRRAHVAPLDRSSVILRM
jgi:WD40 repeat protein